MILATCVYIISNLVAISKCAFEPRIVGGQFAKITNFPHSALLAINCDHRGESETVFSWVCGASILNQVLLLTAAHCLADCTINSWILVSVGHVHMYKGYRTNALSFLIHEEFDAETQRNDIALIRLNSSLPLNSSISRVVLLKNPPFNEKAQTAGWGMIDVSFYAKYVFNLSKLELAEQLCKSTAGHKSLPTYFRIGFKAVSLHIVSTIYRS